MKPNSVVFIEIFTEIEQRLKEICNDPYNSTFSDMLRMASKCNTVVSQYSSDLREYAQLRNAIIHTRRENFIIAEPHDEVIKDMRHIRNLLSNPPKVSSVMLHNPFFTTPSTCIADVLEAFSQHGFLRCPIVDNNKVVGLMNAKSISRWLTSKDRSSINLEESKVDEVLPFIETDDYAFVAENSDVLSLVGLFKNSIKRGRYIQAVLVTRNGKFDGQLVGIITPSDLPVIIESIERA